MKKFMLVVMTLVLVASVAMAQSSAVVDITINTAAAALALTAVPGGVDGCLRGVTYTVVYDAFGAASTVAPNNNGETINGDVGVDIAGDINANVVVEMDLPDYLLGVSGVAMPITFPASGPGGGVRGENGSFFNPNVTNTFNLGSGALATLRLGYVFTIPANGTIAGDGYVGQALVNAYYTGL